MGRRVGLLLLGAHRAASVAPRSHYWGLHMSEQWLTAQLANVLAIADPAADPADPVALVRLARAIMTQEGGDRPPSTSRRRGRLY